MRLILFLSVTGNQQKTPYRKKKFPHFSKNVFCSVLFENLKTLFCNRLPFFVYRSGKEIF